MDRSAKNTDRWSAHLASGKRGEHVEVGQDELDLFLDNGWSVIGRLHQWLSTCQNSANDQLVDTIRDMQSLWSAAEDLQLNRVAYACLMLEQLLERFCARTLEINNERLTDITAGVAVLQELLLGLEATREQPTVIDLEIMHRLYRHATEPECVVIDQQMIVTRATDDMLPGISETQNSTADSGENATPVVDIAGSSTESDVVPTDSQSPAAGDQYSVQSTLLAMLQQFVEKLDDTCQRLHERVIADEAPYVTATSRLEHLVQVTRDLVNQLVGQFAPMASDDGVVDDGVILELESPVVIQPVLVESVESVVQDEKLPIAENETCEPIATDVIPAATFEIEKSMLLEPALAAVPSGRRSILIVEESPFYRQMISMAVRSMGFDSHVVDSTTAVLGELNRSCDFVAILIDTIVPPEVSERLQACRRDDGVLVIGLMSANSTTTQATEFDDQVARSNPRHLREILSGLNVDVTNDARKSA